MSSPPLSHSEENKWHEEIRRRELRRCAETLARIAEHTEFAEDFANEAPRVLAKLIGETANMLGVLLEKTIPSRDLEHVNTLLGFFTPHLRYVERARVSQTPWSIIQSAERLFMLATGAKGHFILRPTWTYNYSIIGEFVSTYRKSLSSWPWFPFDEWEKRVGLSIEDCIYCISFPRIERSNCLLHANWGHEVGHILVAKWVIDGFADTWASDEPEIRKQVEDHVTKNLPQGVDPLFKALTIQDIVARQMNATMQVAKQGLVELLCDRVGVHILGPSAVAATMEFAARFAMDASPLQSSFYPPWRYRLRKMLQHCTPDLENTEGSYLEPEISSLIEWLRYGKRLSAVEGDLEVLKSNPVTREAYKFVDKHWDEAASKVTSMLPSELSTSYRLYEQKKVVVDLVRRIQNGIPPNEISHLCEEPASFQNILVAAWAHKMDQIRSNPSWGSNDDFSLLFRLVLKGCESSFVHSKWGKALREK